jgi:large subunit ribosomal protein L25
MEARPLQTEPRAATGKGPARQLRGQGRVPAILYGSGVEPLMLSLVPKDLVSLLSTAHRRNQLVELRVGAAQHLAMIRELQIHPVTRAFLHVDFLKVDAAREVDVRVPLLATGRPKGVLTGGELREQYRQLPVRAKPGDVPAEIVVDVSELDLNQSIRVKDLKLPFGVTVLLDSERTVFSCSIPRRPPEEEEAAAAAAAAPAAGEGAPAAAGEGEAAKGAEAAPAAAGKAPAAKAPAGKGGKKDE